MLSTQQEKQLKKNQHQNEQIFDDKEYCGIQSLISMTKKQINISTMYFRLDNTLQCQIQETGIELGSQFLYALNCHDLWKYLPYKIKLFQNNFQTEDYHIIKKVLLFGRLHLQYHILREWKRKIKQSKDHILFKKKDVILKKYKENNKKSPIQSEKFKQFIKKVNCLDDFEKLQSIFVNSKIEDVGKNDQVLGNFLKEVLKFIYSKLKKSQGLIKKPAISICLIILYLKISLKTQKWLYVLQSNKYIENMIMLFLGKSNGILKIIRYFQDAPIQVIQNQYTFTRDIFNKNN